MSVSKWAYDPKYCDGDYCPGDCDLCHKVNERDVEVKNLPTDHKPFVVAREVDGEYWYWGSFMSEDHANDIARAIFGKVLFEAKRGHKLIRKGFQND